MTAGASEKSRQELEKEIQQAASDALKRLQTAEGQQELRDRMRAANEENCETRKRSMIDPEELRKPVTL